MDWVLVIFLMSRFDGGVVIYSREFETEVLCHKAEKYYRDEKIRSRILDTGRVGESKRSFQYDSKCHQIRDTTKNEKP